MCNVMPYEMSAFSLTLIRTSCSEIRYLEVNIDYFVEYGIHHRCRERTSFILHEFTMNSLRRWLRSESEANPGGLARLELLQSSEAESGRRWRMHFGGRLSGSVGFRARSTQALGQGEPGRGETTTVGGLL